MLVEGVASRLLAHPDDVKTKILDPSQVELQAQLEAMQPDVIILDSHDPQVRENCPLQDLLHWQPLATILILDSELSELQVVRSQSQPITDTQALLQQILALI